jgi:hypothetical protein
MSKPSDSRTPLLSRDVNNAHNLSRTIQFPSVNAGAPSKRDRRSSDPGRLLPLHTSDAEAQWQRDQRDLVPVNKNGIPKLSRECLVSEIQCYGKYILAVFLVFGIGGVLLALWITQRR